MNKGPHWSEFGCSQIQECVSFTRLCYECYQMSGDKEFLRKAYEKCVKWEEWYETYRMPNKKGLVEIFCGHDTGHDASGRKEGITYKGAAKNNDAINYPDGDEVLPMITPDNNAVFYGTLTALSDMAKVLGEDYEKWTDKADRVREKMIEICYDEEDDFFYDVDKNGNRRKYLLISITNVFTEKVLNQSEFDVIYEKHLKNPNEFWTEYPFPSMAKSDPSFKQNKSGNSWGFYSQALTMLRCT